MVDNLKWEGLDEIQETLKKLPNLKTQNKAIVSAFRTASKSTLLSLENNSPYDTGGLSQSHAFKKAKGSVVDYAKVGSLKSKGGFYGHWMEDGTVQRKTNSGWKTGKVTAMRYFTKSWKSNLTIMRTIVGNKISKIVTSYFKKLHKNR